MKKMNMILIAAVAIALLATISSQAITVKITDDPTGVTSPTSINMANGATKTLYVYMNGQTDNGTVFEGMLCYDNSTVQGSFGHGVGAPATGKLTIANVSMENVTMFPTISGVIPIHMDNATAREASNVLFGGRPFGMHIIGGHKPAIIPGASVKIAQFDVTNHMSSGSWFVALSDAGSGASYTTAWKKNASTIARSAAGLTINTAVASHPTMSGTITLQNLTAGAEVGKAVVIKVYAAGTSTLLETLGTTLASGGAYTGVTSAQPTGTYDVCFKASHWLNKKVAGVSLTAGSNTVVNASLKNGDVNGDNTVDLLDFGGYKAAYNSHSGSGNWNPNADLNGDGTVDLLDFGIYKANYNQHGD